MINDSSRPVRTFVVARMCEDKQGAERGVSEAMIYSLTSKSTREEKKEEEEVGGHFSISKVKAGSYRMKAEKAKYTIDFGFARVGEWQLQFTLFLRTLLMCRGCS